MQPDIRAGEVMMACALGAATAMLVEAMRIQRVEPARKPEPVRKVEPVREVKSSQFPCHFLSRGQYEFCQSKGGKSGARKVDIGEVTGQVLDCSA